jgi:Zn finger protein HypA/HybF involved in hydrogenase expression
MTLQDGRVLFLFIGSSLFEYYCKDCGQLRLSIKNRFEDCGNCHSTNVIVGALNSLDKEALRKIYPLKST